MTNPDGASTSGAPEGGGDVLEDDYRPPESPEEQLLAKAWAYALPLLGQRLMERQEAAEEET
ncbi:hypothetical protein SAMN05421811_103242 [Nonomuraea wenchangensis]|uniref:Uncharacterized protein n=1 Tax=Nonomuraea wenchangensis TaxID=568860 RepID=A0A1I0EXP1_9ACTN|nr:hypothetical protein SAMN05421811_103242 [Nonomuraea wenchangensis]